MGLGFQLYSGSLFGSLIRVRLWDHYAKCAHTRNRGVLLHPTLDLLVDVREVLVGGPVIAFKDKVDIAVSKSVRIRSC